MHENVPVLLLAPFAGFVADVFVQFALSQFAARRGHLRTQFLSFGVGLVVTVIALTDLLWRYPFASADRVGYLILYIMIYVCFGYCFFNVISANVSSLRVRMLKEYLLHDPTPLPDSAMYQRYPARQILEARLARLVSGRQIYMNAGRYYVRLGTVIFIGRFFATLRRFLLPG
jgi:hypothetical protein